MEMEGQIWKYLEDVGPWIWWLIQGMGVWRVKWIVRVAKLSDIIWTEIARKEYGLWAYDGVDNN